MRLTVGPRGSELLVAGTTISLHTSIHLARLGFVLYYLVEPCNVGGVGCESSRLTYHRQKRSVYEVPKIRATIGRNEVLE
jgi:hypothetical protein